MAPARRASDADAYESLAQENISNSPASPLLNYRPSSSSAVANKKLSTSGDDDDARTIERGSRAELQELRDNARLRAQGHEASMQRSFSPFAALGLGFRCVYSHVKIRCSGCTALTMMPASRTLGSATSAALGRT